MTALTLEGVMRRFTDVHSLSQEAIETISLWVMHYRDKRSIDIIVEAWLESFKIGTIPAKPAAIVLLGEAKIFDKDAADTKLLLSGNICRRPQD
ncbi:hypothetical protein OSTOST_02145 [Ostertagia ostertagi]